MLPIKSPFGQRGLYKGSSHGTVTFTIQARPLPHSITAFLQRNAGVIKQLLKDIVGSSPATYTANEDATVESDAHRDEPVQQPAVTVDEFWPALQKLLDDAGPEWKGKNLAERIHAFGPNRVGPNILFGRERENGTKGQDMLS
jgi:ribosome assembly protein 1